MDEQVSSGPLWAEDLTRPAVPDRRVDQRERSTPGPTASIAVAGRGGEEPTMEEISNRGAYQRELNAFKAKLPTLLREYGEEYVAMRQGQIVDVDADEVRRQRGSCSAYPDDYVLVRQVTSSGEAESYMGASIWGDP